MDVEAARASIEQALAYADAPLKHPLEVGFRHSGLSPTERLARYSQACIFIVQDLRRALEALEDTDGR